VRKFLPSIFYGVWVGVDKFSSFAQDLGIFFALGLYIKFSPLHFGPGLIGGWLNFSVFPFL